MSEMLFDTHTGRPLDRGEIQHGIDTDTTRFVSLAALICRVDFPYKKGDFSIESPEAWPRERCIQAGQLAMKVLMETLGDQPGIATTNTQRNAELPRGPRLTRDHAERLHILGIFPSRHVIRELFGGLGSLGQAAEIRTGKNTRYEDWSTDQLVRYAAKLSNNLQRKPREPDYHLLAEQGQGPTLYQITRRIGGVRRLNELIGYPNIHDWAHSEYLDYGMRVLAANEGGAMTARLLSYLSRHKRGPSAKTIETKFGSLSSFQTQAATYKRESETAEFAFQQILLDEYATHTANGFGLADRAAAGRREMVVYASLHRVARTCLPHASPERLSQLSRLSAADFVRMVRKNRPDIRIADIELAAVEHNVFDIVWPLDEWRTYLHVPPEELAYVRRGNRQRFASQSAAIAH